MKHITAKDKGIISDGLLYLASNGQVDLKRLVTDADYFKECVDLYVEAWNTAADTLR